MMKDFELNQILEAINTISKLNSKKIEKKFTNKDDVSTYDNKNKQEILVLSQMIE